MATSLPPLPLSDNPYEILALSRSADDSLIKKQYRVLALAHHPDKHQNSPEATANFRRIEEAHSLLKDHEKRAQWDKKNPPPRERPSEDGEARRVKSVLANLKDALDLMEAEKQATEAQLAQAKHTSLGAQNVVTLEAKLAALQSNIRATTDQINSTTLREKRRVAKAEEDWLAQEARAARRRAEPERRAQKDRDAYDAWASWVSREMQAQENREKAAKEAWRKREEEQRQVAKASYEMMRTYAQQKAKEIVEEMEAKRAAKEARKRAAEQRRKDREMTVVCKHTGHFVSVQKQGAKKGTKKGAGCRISCKMCHKASKRIFCCQQCKTEICVGCKNLAEARSSAAKAAAERNQQGWAREATATPTG